MAIVARWIARVIAGAGLLLAAAGGVLAAGPGSSAGAASVSSSASSSVASSTASPVLSPSSDSDGFVAAMAWGAQPRYQPGFTHFNYVNPDAPRGGTLSLDGFGSFDKVNPFTLKGVVAAGVGPLMFDSLT